MSPVFATRTLVIFVIGFATFSSCAGAGELSKLTLSDKRTALLGGRLSVKIPPAAMLQPRKPNIMAAPEANEDETRVVLDAGKERLVLMAYELYALSGANFEKAVRIHAASAWPEQAAKYKFETLAVQKPINAVGLTPPLPDGKREANLVYRVYVAREDGTVQLLDFYVNPEGTKDLPGSTTLANAIALTLAAGARKLETLAGDRGFIDPGIIVTVPQGVVASTQQGPDFSVYRLRKLLALGQNHSSCGIYFGGHPDFQHRQLDDPSKKVTTVKGMLLGQNVEWQSWSQHGQVTDETILPYPKGGRMSLHVFCSATETKEVSALRAMVATMRAAKTDK